MFSVTKKKIIVLKKLIIPIFFLIGTVIQLSAQGNTYKSEHEGWLVSLDEAYALSQKTGKPILANFTGSDWCFWCKKLHASVFAHQEFRDWAKKNVILLELDFPRRKRLPEAIRNQNASLQKAFQIRGYPTVWVFDLEKDAAGKFSISALGSTGFTKTVPEFTKAIDQMIARRK